MEKKSVLKILRIPLKIFQFTIALIILSSCGGGGNSTDIQLQDIIDNEDLSPIASTPSCSDYPSAQNTQICSFTKDDLTREFYIYIPDNYSEYISPVSVLLSLHGGDDFATSNMYYSGFNEHADSDNFLIIYPQGAFYGDKGSTGWNHEYGGVNDVGFIEDIIDWLGNNYNVQLNEVYAAGFSNGAFMTYHLACNLSNKIAAIAPVAGLMGNHTYSTCNSVHPMPMIHIHGEQDNIISILGGDYFKSLEDSEESDGVITYWKENNQCQSFSEEPIYNNTQIEGTLHLWTACSNDTEINYLIIQNQGHEWPEDGDKGSGVIDTSETIWNFLKRFDMNGLKTN